MSVRTEIIHQSDIALMCEFSVKWYQLDIDFKHHTDIASISLKLYSNSYINALLNRNFHTYEFVTRVTYSYEFLTHLCHIRTNMAHMCEEFVLYPYPPLKAKTNTSHVKIIRKIFV